MRKRERSKKYLIVGAIFVIVLVGGAVISSQLTGAGILAWFKSFIAPRGNNAPTQEKPLLKAVDHPYNRTNATVTAYPQNLSDADGDNVSIIADWRENGTSMYLLNMPFDTETTKLKDYSTFNVSATVSGSPTWTSFGKVGGAYIFTGAEHIDLGDQDAWEFGPDDAFTIELWAKPSSLDFGSLIAKANGSAPTKDWTFALFIPPSKATYRFAIGTGVGFDIISLSPPKVDKWVHLVITAEKKGGKIKGYVNGTLYGDGTTTASITRTADQLLQNNESVILGKNYGTYKGMIDEVRIYNRALSAQQIRSNYLAGIANHTNYDLTPAETKVNDLWSVAVTPTDGKDEGNTTLSNTVKINPEDFIWPHGNVSNCTEKWACSDLSYTPCDNGTQLEICSAVTDKNKCNTTANKTATPYNATINCTKFDIDGDGYNYTADCDELDPDISPGATENCTDKIDNDCDDLIDAADSDCEVTLIVNCSIATLPSNNGTWTECTDAGKKEFITYSCDTSIGSWKKTVAKTEECSTGLSGAVWAAIIIGGLVVLGGIGFGVWYFVFKRRRSDAAVTSAGNEDTVIEEYLEKKEKP